MLSKADTLKLLEDHGFNVVDHRVMKQPFDLEKILPLIKTLWGSRISVRTWKEGQALCPFYPNIRRVEVYDILKKEWRKIKLMDEIILSEGINPSDSLRAGKVSHLKHSNEVVLEFFRGPGTVRLLDKMPQHDIVRYILHPTRIFTEMTEWDLRYLLAQAVNFFSVYPGTTIEWSQYPYKIGRKKRTIIFWEVLF